MSGSSVKAWNFACNQSLVKAKSISLLPCGRANASGTRPGPMMKRTANFSFGRRSIGRSWLRRRSWKFEPQLGLPLKSPRRHCCGSWLIPTCTTSRATYLFRVEMWDRSDQHVRWMMAASASVAIGHAAMDAAIANYPDSGSRCGMGYWSFDSIREFSGLF